MRREFRGPPSEEGVPQSVTDDLVRGRVAVAAGCAIAGLAAAAGWPPWPASPLLIAALLLALVTLAFAVATHHLPAAALPARVVLIAVLPVFDACVLAGAAGAAGSRGATALLALLLAALLALQARAQLRVLARRTAKATAAKPPGEEAELATLADAIGGRVREAIGIARARAEALRLAVDESGAGEVLGHDLDVLVRQVDECQRALRELEHAVALRQRGAARLPPPAPPPPEGATDRDGWPSESTPLRS